MLKAYDYIVTSPDRSMLQSEGQGSEEWSLAEAAVSKINCKKVPCSSGCIACGCFDIKPFFEKWGVTYYRCLSCESVFVAADADILEVYKKDEDLLAFRKEKKYQDEASDKRDLIWDELLEWVSFRAFRYLGTNKGLVVTDFGNRYVGLIKKIKESKIFRSYSLRDSIWGETAENERSADIILSFDRIQQTSEPLKLLTEANAELSKGGLLFLSARMGTGFDILTLKSHAQIYPYEYVFLPSRQALFNLLERGGFKLLDYSTPGQMDVGYVMSRYEHIEEDNYLIRSLLRDADATILGEFQRFLQKSCMSSYARIVARKEVDL